MHWLRMPLHVRECHSSSVSSLRFLDFTMRCCKLTFIYKCLIYIRLQGEDFESAFHDLTRANPKIISAFHFSFADAGLLR